MDGHMNQGSSTQGWGCEELRSECLQSGMYQPYAENDYRQLGAPHFLATGYIQGTSAPVQIGQQQHDLRGQNQLPQMQQQPMAPVQIGQQRRSTNQMPQVPRRSPPKKTSPGRKSTACWVCRLTKGAWQSKRQPGDLSPKVKGGCRGDKDHPCAACTDKERPCYYGDQEGWAEYEKKWCEDHPNAKWITTKARRQKKSAKRGAESDARTVQEAEERALALQPAPMVQRPAPVVAPPAPDDHNNMPAHQGAVGDEMDLGDYLPQGDQRRPDPPHQQQFERAPAQDLPPLAAPEDAFGREGLIEPPALQWPAVLARPLLPSGIPTRDYTLNPWNSMEPPHEPTDIYGLHPNEFADVFWGPNVEQNHAVSTRLCNLRPGLARVIIGSCREHLLVAPLVTLQSAEQGFWGD